MARLVALYRTNELPFHFKRALGNGVTEDELVELITHLAFYAGWPATGMTHIAMQENLNGKVVEWMKKVSDEQYRR